MIKKIITAEERKRRDKRNGVIIAIVIGVIMILSTAGYFVSDFSQQQTNKFEYKNIKFTQTDSGTWAFSYGSSSYETKFLPNETLNISGSINKKISDYYNQPLYIGINSKEDIASNGNYELLKNIGNIIFKSQFSCLDINCTEDYAIKNCSNNVIIFKETNITKLSNNQNCVTLEYQSGNDEKIVDAFLYKVLGL